MHDALVFLAHQTVPIEGQNATPLEPRLDGMLLARSSMGGRITFKV